MQNQVNVREVLNSNRKDRTEGIGRLSQLQREALKLQRVHTKKAQLFSLENRVRLVSGR